MLPYTPMVCVVAILGAMLQVHGRFGPTAAAPILLNVAIMAAALGAGPFLRGRADGAVTTMTVVAAAVLVAGILQVIWSLLALRGHHRWSGGLRDALAPARQIIGPAIPMIVGLGVLQLNTFFDGLIASYPAIVGPRLLGLDYPLTEGAMASVSFATRLYQFPLGVFGIAVATAIFPALARASGDDASFASILRRGLRIVVFIGLPASAGLLVVGGPLAEVVLRGGAFGAGDAQRVARVLAGYAPAIWAYSMTHVLTRAFYARGDVRRPVKVAVSMVGLNLLLNCLLIWTPLREAGLAWSTATCATLQVAILLAMARRHAPDLIDRHVRRSWLASALLSLLMAGAVMLIHWWLPPASSWRLALGELVLLVAAGAAIVAAGARILRMPELRWALGRGGD
jgi:putative peptidoglycan lipid II flippase